MPHLPLEVFISSTCYDLLDLRSELATYLTEQGCIVRISEDPMSGFCVDPIGDSIESCLRNVENSDIVVCILDRRYGGKLGGRFSEMSATECEVRHARETQPPKPVLFFVRNAAFAEFQQHQSNPAVDRKWVEPGNADNFARWFRFFEHVKTLPVHENRSNWFDQFQTVSDLKPVLMKRLREQFADRLASRALDPNRLVRLTFESSFVSQSQVNGVFVNVGVGPALNLQYGTKFQIFETPIGTHGGLREGARLTNGSDDFVAFRPSPQSSTQFPTTIYCNYENRFGDRYRIERDVGPSPDTRNAAPADRRIMLLEVERFYIGQVDNGGDIKWELVTR